RRAPLLRKETLASPQGSHMLDASAPLNSKEFVTPGRRSEIPSTDLWNRPAAMQ
ncbi:hypothetical protein P7K49_018630, partial [Saguinus oedipus]